MSALLPALPEDYPRVLLAASVSVIERIASLEDDEDRQERMRVHCARRREALATAFDRPVGRPGENVEALAGLTDGWARDARMLLLVDLSFADPFAPYEIRVREHDLHVSVKEVARATGLRNSDVEAIVRTRRDIAHARRRPQLGRAIAFGAGGLVLIGALGFLAAPAIGAFLGAAAGLSGAAATAHGLALIGGGTLAAGGLGAAGGLWVVAGLGAVAGLAGGAGGAALLALGEGRARLELERLQTTFRLVLIEGQVAQGVIEEVVKQTESRLREAEAILQEERDLNDESSRRLQALEATLEALEEAVGWMREEARVAV